MKKTICTVLLLAFVAGTMAVAQEPAASFQYDLNQAGNGIIIKRYIGSNSRLVIPGRIEGYPVVQIGNRGQIDSRYNFLVSVVIPENVTVISDKAFESQKRLTSVTFPSTLKVIGEESFEYCDLRTIRIPDSVTTIGRYAFAYNSNLTDVNIPASIQAIGTSAFSDCKALSNVTIPTSVKFIKWGLDLFTRAPDAFSNTALSLAARRRLAELEYDPTTPTPPPATPVTPEMVRINGDTTANSFYMGKYEVTQKEWTAIMGSNPSYFKGDNLPVEYITWFDAVEYCNKRSQKEGLTPAYTIRDRNRSPGTGSPITSADVTWNQNANGYRLPTEAEWEYAARGGNGSPGNFTYAGSNNADEVAWYNGNRTHNVGTKKPNGLGLYDMSGNVSEWCWDKGSYGRILRGGGWSGSANDVRSAARVSQNEGAVQSSSVGFRVVRTDPEVVKSREAAAAQERAAREQAAAQERAAAEQRRKQEAEAVAALERERQAAGQQQTVQKAPKTQGSRNNVLSKSAIIIDGWLGSSLVLTQGQLADEYGNAQDEKLGILFSGGPLIGWCYGYFALQTGLNVIGTKNTFWANNSSEYISLTVFQLPVLARLNIDIEELFYFSPYAGVGFNVSSQSNNKDIDVQSLSTSFIGGVDFGAGWSIVKLVLGLQYNGDMNDNVIHYKGKEHLYKNSRVSLNLGVHIQVPLH